MPSSQIRTFTDPDDYASAIRQGTVELTITERGRFAATLVRIDLHRLWMQRFSENLARTSHIAGWGGRAVVAFRTRPGPRLFSAGIEMRPTDITRHVQGESYYRRSSGPVSYAGMSLPVEDAAAIGETLAGCDLTPPRNAVLITPRTPAMERLQRLHAAAGRLAEEAPEIIANLDAARGLEQALIEALAACLSHQERRENGVAQGQHAIVMRRFRRIVEEAPEQPLYIPDICKVIRVSERTLRMCCQEHLGMPPKRYLLLRRMAFARRALHRAAPDATSVTDIAMRYGFWQLGRFAVEYQTLFGESPSATLHRQFP